MPLVEKIPAWSVVLGHGNDEDNSIQSKIRIFVYTGEKRRESLSRPVRVVIFLSCIECFEGIKALRIKGKVKKLCLFTGESKRKSVKK